MVAVGGARGMFRIYNNTLSTQLSVMRALNGHTNELRDVLWDYSDCSRILSCSSDKTVRYWDITESLQVGKSMSTHSDSVRCMDWIKNSNTISDNDNNTFEFISGSYDHTCKLWDLRNFKDNLTFTHTSHIDDCLHIPNSDLIAIAGTPDVTIWSLRKNSSKPLFTLKMHRKTVNCLAVNSDGTRLFTACLDKQVRIFDCHSNEFANTHVFSLPSAVLSVDISNDGRCIAMATLQNGILFKTKPNNNNNNINIQIDDTAKKSNETNDNDIEQLMKSSFEMNQKIDDKKMIRYGSKDWFIRGQKSKQGLTETEKREAHSQAQSKKMDDIKMSEINDQGSLLIDQLNRSTMSVTFKQRSKLKQYDMALKQFRYADALDAALSTKDTLTVHSVLQDLWRRDGLQIALGGRDYKRLIPILEYMIYSLPHPHLSETSMHCCAIIIDLYKSVIGGVNDQIDDLFLQMYQCVSNMIKKYKILLKLQGSIEAILSAQDIIANPLPKSMLDFNDKVESVVQKILQSRKINSNQTNNTTANTNTNTNTNENAH